MHKLLEDRVARLKDVGKQRGFSGFIIATLPNMRYFTGVSVLAIERFAAVIIPIDSEPVFIVPELEEEKIKSLSPFKNVLKYDDAKGPVTLVKSVLEELRLTSGRLGIEGFFPYRFYKMVNNAAPKARLEEASDIFIEFRIVKIADELELMRKAGEIIVKGIDAGVTATRVGATELEIGFEIERRIKQLGGDSVPYCIVLRGENAAFPHGSSSKAEIRQGDTLVMDVSATYEGYFADLTRTVFVGSASARQHEIYDTVLQAQEKAIESVKPGIRAGEIDKAARNVIKEAGYGERFIHRTGHGLGLEVHEDPSITENCTMILRPGMTFTVEPGIYVPQELGVRIEDNIVVTEKGKTTIAACEKSLTIV